MFNCPKIAQNDRLSIEKYLNGERKTKHAFESNLDEKHHLRMMYYISNNESPIPQNETVKIFSSIFCSSPANIYA